MKRVVFRGVFLAAAFAAAIAFTAMGNSYDVFIMQDAKREDRKIEANKGDKR